MKREDARRWLEGWEAAAEVQRQEIRARGCDPERAIRLSLSMIDAAGVRRPDPGRLRDDAEVREIWARLKARWAG